MLDALVHEKVFIKLLHRRGLLHHEFLFAEVLHPRLELTERDAIPAVAFALFGVAVEAEFFDHLVLFVGDLVVY